MLRLLCAVTVMVAVPAMSQTIYKCPDANGRIALQDLPCAGGEQRHIRPASGSDQKAAVTPSVPSTAAPKSDLDRLRDSVGKDAAARKFKDADYEVSVYDKRINQFPVYRAYVLETEAIFNVCGSGKYTFRCEDMVHRDRLEARLAMELNQLNDLRTNAHAVKRAANKEHFAITQKWLED